MSFAGSGSPKYAYSPFENPFVGSPKKLVYTLNMLSIGFASYFTITPHIVDAALSQQFIG